MGSWTKWSQRQRQKKCTGLITTIILAITINQCTRVLNTASFSEDQTATWWQLISSELFLYEGTKMCSYWNRYLFSLWICSPCSPCLPVPPGTESLSALFMIMVSYTTLSLLFYHKSSKAVSNVHEGLLSFHVPHYPLSWSYRMIEWSTELSAVGDNILRDKITVL